MSPSRCAADTCSVFFLPHSLLEEASSGLAAGPPGPAKSDFTSFAVETLRECKEWMFYTPSIYHSVR